MANIRHEDILKNQLYLSKFGNVDLNYTDQLTLSDMRVLAEQVEKWEKEIGKANKKLEEAKFKALFKGLQKLFGGRR